MEYCDTTTDDGGWFVFQRWQDGSVDLYRDWETYKEDFGSLLLNSSGGWNNSMLPRVTDHVSCALTWRTFLGTRPEIKLTNT